jgi:hypothetical protein
MLGRQEYLLRFKPGALKLPSLRMNQSTDACVLSYFRGDQICPFSASA